MDFVIRKINGERRWFGTPSNNARDREHEIVSKAALDEVVAREKAANRYPELQFFHIDYPMGETDYYAVTDGILTASGTFLESDPVAKAFADYVETHPAGIDGSGWGMSWRFYASPNPQRVFEHIKSIVEFTFLPLNRAANPYTQFGTEVVKMLTDEQRKAVELVTGDATLVALVEQSIAARNKSAALDEAGVQRKATADTPATPAPVETKAAESTDAPKCKACGHAMHEKACGVDGCDCGASGKKALEAEPLTYGDLVGIKQFIEESVSKAVAAEQSTRQQATDTVIEQVNVNLKALTEAVNVLHEKIDHVEAVDKALAEAHEMPRGSYAFLKSLSAAQSPATEVKPEDALAQAAPTETNTEFFAR